MRQLSHLFIELGGQEIITQTGIIHSYHLIRVEISNLKESFELL